VTFPAVHWLSLYCRQPQLRVLRSGDVLSVGGVQRLYHLHAEANTVSEEHGELRSGGQGWQGDAC
jgi:hypothetical protein